MTALPYETVVRAIARSHGLPEPMPEYRFAPPRRFRFDFAWPELKLAIEIDGGIYGRGPACRVCKQRRASGHGAIGRQKSDREKMRLAAKDGWVVAPFLVEEVKNGVLLAELPDLMRRRMRVFFD